uniref:Zinc fingers and homeoboxes protein 1 n=1 Tax=Oncorhynchus tshawytscha TaxID=74940 RepID=A0A8C8GYP9_ONCTS
CTGVKHSNQPTLEQTLSDLLSDGGYIQHETEESDDPASSAQAQLLIPVSSIPSYNQSMDTNTVLVNTYKKFPYPSVSEIMGLSAQTKFSEEQIKIWFSAQRLKHGVSWTPEEVLFLLDSCLSYTRFNGTVHTVPQTITVIPAHQLSAAANGMPSHSLVPKMSSHQTSPAVSEMKRATTVQPPSLTPQENSALSADHFGMRPKKSKEQLAELKASYLKNHFASDAEIARLMMLTCLTKGEIKKWFSDTRYNQRNSKNSNVIMFHDSQSPRGHGSGTTIVIDSSDETPQSPPPTPTPSVKEKEPRPKTWNSFPDFTLQKFKEKTAEQLVVLEESYQKGSTPSDDELTRLRTETKLTRREIDAWFTEKRKVVEAESPELKAERMESEATSSKKRSQTPPCGRRPNRGDKNIGKKTPEQLHVLKSAFVRTQWPSTEEYDKLAEESGLPRVYVVNWFGDTRYSFKNGNLKWFFHYQSGNVEGLNGNKNRKRRIRNRGWGRSRSRKVKRSTSTEKSPPQPLIKLKSGKDILKEYYLKHKLLNEQDLDELVTKSSMGYEQVREWFAEVHKREDMGADPFGDVEHKHISLSLTYFKRYCLNARLNHNIPQTNDMCTFLQC